jgi:hypothetical protein
VLHSDGLFLGSSAAMNCVGAVKAARELGPGHTVVTVLCDSGTRHLSKFWNADVLKRRGLADPGGGGVGARDSSLEFVSRQKSAPAFHYTARGRLE